VNALILLGLIALLVLLWLRLLPRVRLSLAKQPSLEGHPRWARHLARLIPYYEYDEQQFFCADGAPPDVAAKRRAAFGELAALYATRFAKSAALTTEVATGVADLQFTARYRVPFQFSRRVREHLKGGAFLASSAASTLTDLDGNRLYDLAGSYGVNLFGYDFYKDCIRAGNERAASLGPVLGAYHPCVADNVARLRGISGLDQVSFHMSGTEAVMQAVRLARYHTRKRYLVRFCGAYHGWWGDVQPGAGNPATAHDTYTLQDMSTAALRILRSRCDIACVLVNPLQALHPNRGAASDGALIDSSRSAAFDRAAYSAWLLQLRNVCSERGIVLIFDEVFLGFRLAPGGAQEYFGVRADLVTYGKTVAGGLPVGLLCGKAALMQRFDADRPADICFARGTFNAHPYVMTAMNEFLKRLETAPVRALYQDLDAVWNRRAAKMNELLRLAGVPASVANLSSVWTVIYRQPSRYNWMFQYYLRAHGLALSWVGTARLIFNLAYTDAEFADVIERFIAAAVEMRDAGWWWTRPGLTNRLIRRRVLREMLQIRCSWLIGSMSSPRSR